MGKEFSGREAFLLVRSRAYYNKSIKQKINLCNNKYNNLYLFDNKYIN